MQKLSAAEKDRILLVLLLLMFVGLFLYASRTHDAGMIDSAHDDIELVLGVLLGLIMGHRIGKEQS